MKGYFRQLRYYAYIFLIVQLILRTLLMVYAAQSTSFTAWNTFVIFAKGFAFDIVTMMFCLSAVSFFKLLCSYNKIQKAADIVLRIIFTYLILFNAIAEFLYWDEFNTRFNFIAVDYLIYTREVIGNIIESYPVYKLLSIIGLLSILISIASYKFLAFTCISAKRSALEAISIIAISVIGYFGWDVKYANIENNHAATELSLNGMYSFGNAFWNNEITYNRFYISQDDESVKKNLAKLILPHPTNDEYLLRRIEPQGAERRSNVIIVIMESMSAEYMAHFGNNENITPELDKLADNSLFFSNILATGTRTVRGLEAVSLSIPPTPGQSIVRRTDNHNLFSLGFIFKERNYDTKFIYGGYGYFDNMNEFFAGNGFDIIDRSNMPENEIQFSNIWGVCDEDLYARTIAEADESYDAQKPFMYVLMTTSNHRPFTYPDGKIDIPNGAGRNGGVKYADYSVGQLIENAKKKAWFKDTIFVFVADHTAGAGGKKELDVKKYHIPMLFYAPNIVDTKKVDMLASQIDLAPTLLGLMNFKYDTKFYGQDLLQPDVMQRAFVSNFQKVSLIKDGKLLVLSPFGSAQYTWPEMEKEAVNDSLLSDTIAYYQSASWWRDAYKKLEK